VEKDEEELDSPQALRRWLLAHGLIETTTPVSAADLRRALDVREGLRALLAAHNGAPLDREAMARLEAAAGRATLRPGIAPDGTPVLVPARRCRRGTWSRLKARADEDCRWAFYDHSKNRSGRWCSIRTCGNQHKARALRERRRAGANAPGRKARS